MAHFHQFCDLPNELQDMIWDRAIRDDQPAVQFLSIYQDLCNGDNDDDDTFVTASHRVQVAAKNWWWSLPVALGAPLSNSHTGQHSWSCNNNSIYMEDSGLWTACKASRERMIRFFQPSTTSTRVDAALQSKIHPSTVHMGFRRDNGEQQYLTIRPTTDLVCLQPVRGRRGLTILNDYGRSWEDFNEYPLFCKAQDSYIANNYRALKNIAIEFDPKWTLPDSNVLRRHFSWVRKLKHLKFFWFIDYRLKRRTIAGPVDPTECLSVFHGRDRMFVEVPHWCMKWTYGDADEKDDDAIQGSSLIKVAGMVTAHAWADECEDDYEEYNEWDEPVDKDEGYGYGDPKFGVLACVRVGNRQATSSLGRRL